MILSKYQRKQLKIQAERQFVSELEEQFANLWRILAPEAPEPQRQVRFASDREFTLDFAWIPYLVFLEVQGGTFTAGRHSRGTGQRDDATKNNLAVKMGWRPFYATTDMISEDPQGLMNDILACLDKPKPFSKSIFTAQIRSMEVGDRVDIRAFSLFLIGKKEMLIERQEEQWKVKGRTQLHLFEVLMKELWPLL